MVVLSLVMVATPRPELMVAGIMYVALVVSRLINLAGNARKARPQS